MASTYKTPGVYIEEVSLFPPSVAQVETAVPAFIGYTKKASLNGKSLTLEPHRISSFAEFDEAFGGGPEVQVKTVELDADSNVTSVSLEKSFLLHDSVRLFYANGGAKCYIISVGPYPAGTDGADVQDFERGLAALEKKDEPTLILFPDAVLLGNDKLYALQQQALEQCAKLGDRFAILDLYPMSESLSTFQATVDDFRDKIGIRNLMYGAAYAPYLRTNLPKDVTYRSVKGKITRGGAALDVLGLTTNTDLVKSIGVLENAIADVDRIDGVLGSGGFAQLEGAYLKVENVFKSAINNPGASIDAQYNAYKGVLNALFAVIKQLGVAAANANGSLSAETNKPPFTAPAQNNKPRYVINDIREAIASAGSVHTETARLKSLIVHSTRVEPDSISESDTITKKLDLDELSGDWGELQAGEAGDYYKVDPSGLTGTALTAAFRANMQQGAGTARSIGRALLNHLRLIHAAAQSYERTYEAALVAQFPTLRAILNEVKNTVTELPPCGAIAGVYSSVDASRGVHKAPANVSLNSVVGLTALISHDDQQDLNVDVVAGKSVNAIRPFTGKGILVWGARTLAGNDNEWRYVSVRRFFNMVEESSKKATEHFVFEPNDANTWTKVKSMIENFLFNQWRAGALAGARPEDAFFVKVGLGQTMTAQDIFEGRMVVEIGLAVVRPAEFIVLRFSHMMQKS